MRFFAAAFASSLAVAGAPPVFAAPTAQVAMQVTDAERAAARELFKEGDELQRAGKFIEALDKFNRAQQVFSAPTNMLRIAECDAALGKLVESEETYRTLVRTPLPAGAPPAFQAAVDQARAELSQVEPRVPRLIVQVEPKNVDHPQMQIDGQTVNAALIGEPLPLDPGPHRVMVFAPGFVSSEQSVVLRERDSRALVLVLKPIAGVTYAGSASAAAPPPLAGADQNVPPPPPPPIEEPQPPPKKSKSGLLLGAHAGALFPGGDLPLAPGSTIDITTVSSAGPAFGIDGGLRFARRFYLGLTLEHASLGAGSAVSSSADVSSSATLVAAMLGYMFNPDRVSLYGEVGLGGRFYNFSSGAGGTSNSYSAAELELGAGIWLPIGKSLRLLPKVDLGAGSFTPPGTSASSSTAKTSHLFTMLGVGGYYSSDF